MMHQKKIDAKQMKLEEAQLNFEKFKHEENITKGNKVHDLHVRRLKLDEKRVMLNEKRGAIDQ